MSIVVNEKSRDVREILLDLKSLITRIEEDFPKNLDGYLNKKELDYIQSLEQGMGSIIPSLMTAMAYIDHVEAGTYDCDRRGAYDTVSDKVDEWCKDLGL